MTSEIQVKIADVIFHNNDNGYTVAIGEADDMQCTAVGILPSNAKGRIFVLRGDWKTHPTYGEQFAFSESEEIMPSTDDGIIELLSSGILKGVGPKMAMAIVGRFKGKTLEIIENNPGRLTEVSGIGEKKAEAIAESFKLHREFATVSLFFQQYSIGAEYAMKLYKQYGPDTISLIKENPYRIIGDIRGIGFRKADIMAQKLGIAKDDEYRIESGVKYTLYSFIADGHTFAYKSELCERAAELLDVSIEAVENAIINLAFSGELHVDKLCGSQCIYPYRYFEAEKNVCAKLSYLENSNPKPVTADIDNMMNIMEREKGIILSSNQRAAVAAAVTNSVCVITGGPGTGKTTIINAIMQIITYCGMELAIAAPTGRAAKRITETSGYEAMTIHRLLEYSFSESDEYLRFGRNKENPLDCEAVIIDEASMIDLLLMDGLVSALKPGTRLILVGDADQLPSVGAGNVLRDIIESEYVHCVQLTEIFRQARESLIVVNAHRINQGEYPDYNEKDKDFFLLKRDGERQMLETIKDLCVRRLPEFFSQLDSVRDIQVLTPVRKNIIGCINLNNELQEVLNPPKPELAEKKIGGRIFRVGDKVMQTKNNYTLKWKRATDAFEGEGVFNGDMGIVVGVDNEFNKMTVVFDEDKHVSYDATCFDELELAYAVTVHKSQGSEFPVVVMPVSWFPPMLATRNLLYTAVTRGKKMVVLVGSEGKLRAMVDNNSIRQRNSGLKARLSALIGSVIFGEVTGDMTKEDDSVQADIDEIFGVE